jgi:hypothetical protein
VRRLGREAVVRAGDGAKARRSIARRPFQIPVRDQGGFGAALLRVARALAPGGAAPALQTQGERAVAGRIERARHPRDVPLAPARERLNKRHGAQQREACRDCRRRQSPNVPATDAGDQPRHAQSDDQHAERPARSAQNHAERSQHERGVGEPPCTEPPRWSIAHGGRCGHGEHRHQRAEVVRVADRAEGAAVAL